MKELYKAISNFQKEVPTIHEGTKGYGYTYSDLKTIFKTINPSLYKHGLGFTQLLDGDTLKTIVFHYESGEQIESSVNIPQDVTLKGMNKFQVMGSAITYMRRYSLSAILGLVTDKDTDAAGEQKQIDYKAKLKACKTSEELRNVFMSIPNKTAELVALKDELKTKLK